METETPAASSSRRPRTSLLVLLGIVMVWFLVMSRESADPVLPTSNPGRSPQPSSEKLDPAALDVRLEALDAPPPQPDKADRNPFRFQPKAPPPPPPSAQVPPKTATVIKPEPPGPDPIPQPPPIALKFIGVTEAAGVGKIAALTDCRYTEHGREGEIVYGRYRLVKIGVESLVIEYTDGKGRTTLRMNGQGCAG